MSKQCTKCKKIFDDSFTVCPDCKMGLITVISQETPAEAEKDAAPANGADSASQNKEISVFSLTNEESASRVVDYLKEQGIDAYYQFVLRERIYKIYVSQDNAKAALRAYTAFYAVEAKRLKAEEDKRRAEEEAKRRAEEEAKRRAEEEARRRAEEEERRKIEEAERQKRIEEERLRAQEEAILKAEEEARAKKEEAERAKAEVEAKIRAAEEAKIKAAQEAKEKAEKEAQQKLAEVEKLKAQAEEARKKAEEAKKRVEEEAKRRAEEERKKAAQEALQRKAEEEKRKREESEQRKSRFAESFSMIDESARPRKREAFNFEDSESSLPKVDADTVGISNSIPKRNDIFSSQPDNGPIFVETEPVDEYNIGDTIIVDAVEVDPSEETFDLPPAPPEIEESYNDFFSNIKKDKFTSLFGETPKKEETSFFDQPAPTFTEQEAAEAADDFFNQRYETEPEPVYTAPEPAKPVVEDMFSDNIFSSTDKSSKAPESPIEEVISKDVQSSADKFKSAFDVPKTGSTSGKKDFASMFKDLEKKDSLDDLDNGSYRGFVPDYHEDGGDEDEDAKLAKSYGFDPEAYKKLKEKTEKNIQERKNAPKIKKKDANPDFVVMDEVKIEEYQGFVPDYGKKEGNDMSNFTSRIEIDYSKYRKGGAAAGKDESNSLATLSGTLRSTNQYELNKLFSNEAVKSSAQPSDYSALKSTNFVLALTGGQLNSLFTSWLITNCTKTTVKQYEKATATNEENYDHKIEGIKSLLRSNFGKLDESALDIIVKRFYNKYLDE